MHPLTPSKGLTLYNNIRNFTAIDSRYRWDVDTGSAGVSPSMGGMQWIEGEGKSGVCAHGYWRSNCDAITTNNTSVSILPFQSGFNYQVLHNSSDTGQSVCLPSCGGTS